MNDCPKCDHQSTSDLEAYRHWLEHQRYQAPIIEKGTLVSVVVNGEIFTDRVTDVVFDRISSGQKIMIGDGDDKLSRAMTLVQNVIDTTVVLTKPRRVPLWAWKIWLKIRR